jgi:hypothetical protein
MEQNSRFLCETCGEFYSSAEDTLHHLTNHNSEFRKIESLAKCRIETFVIGNPERIVDLEEYLNWVRPKIVQILNESRTGFPAVVNLPLLFGEQRLRLRPPRSPQIRTLRLPTDNEYYWWRSKSPPLSASFVHHSFKINIVLDVQFVREGGSCEDVSVRRFKTPNTPLYMGTDVNNFVGIVIQKLVNEKDSCTSIGSGWTMVTPISMEIRKNVYSPMCSDHFFNNNNR